MEEMFAGVDVAGSTDDDGGPKNPSIGHSHTRRFFAVHIDVGDLGFDDDLPTVLLNDIGDRVCENTRTANGVGSAPHVVPHQNGMHTE